MGAVFARRVVSASAILVASFPLAIAACGGMDRSSSNSTSGTKADGGSGGNSGGGSGSSSGGESGGGSGSSSGSSSGGSSGSYSGGSSGGGSGSSSGCNSGGSSGSGWLCGPSATAASGPAPACPSPPLACGADFPGATAFATVQDAANALVGRWSFCGSTANGFPWPNQLGEEFTVDGKYYALVMGSGGQLERNLDPTFIGDWQVLLRPNNGVEIYTEHNGGVQRGGGLSACPLSLVLGGEVEARIP